MLTMAAFHLGAPCYYAGYFNGRSHWNRSIINVISTTCAFAVTIRMSIKKRSTGEPSAHGRFFCLLKKKKKKTKQKRQKHAEMDFWNVQKASMSSVNKVVTGLTLS